MRRRQFLALCSSSAGSVLLSRCGRGQTQTAPKPQVKRPKLHTSRNGVLELDLRPAFGDLT